ncbi:hypothetical protein V8C86DRAFT_2431221 [Haematococcus lacustris]
MRSSPVRVLAALTVIWIACVARSWQSPEHRIAALLAPLAVPAALGVFLLVRLVHGVITFNSCPEALESLQKELAVAKEDLINSGTWQLAQRIIEQHDQRTSMQPPPTQ